MAPHEKVKYPGRSSHFRFAGKLIDLGFIFMSHNGMASDGGFQVKFFNFLTTSIGRCFAKTSGGSPDLATRRLEMSLRRRDVEQWMKHRRLPENLRSQVRQAERYNWVSTRGVNEEWILENLPEDLQRNIRRHLFKFVKKVRIFALMDYEPILDAIRERMRPKTYIEGSEVLTSGDIIEKMVFIVRGKMESRVDGIVVPLSVGDVCGEELLAWCLEHSSVNRDVKRPQVPGHRLVSNRTVRCLSNVEAFSLRAADLEEVTSMFSRFLRNPRVQGAIRYESPYWRYLAATRIQVAWRYRKRRLSRAGPSHSNN